MRPKSHSRAFRPGQHDSMTANDPTNLEQPHNVVQRLQRRIHQTRTIGYEIRLDLFEGQQTGWCELRGIKTIFLDASQTAGEQLSQLEEILDDIAAVNLPAALNTSQAA